jgi:hypothetical protein
VVGVVEIAAIVVEVEAEVAVVMEEGVVLQRGSLALAPSEEKSTVVLVPPLSVPNLHQHQLRACSLPSDSIRPEQ